MNNIKPLFLKYKIEFGIVIISLLLTILSLLGTKEQKKITVASSKIEVDSLIPLGYTLIPIEIKNLSQVSFLIGEYGVVSIFEAGNNAQPIAQGVRLIRSPLDSGHFAVLAPQNKSHVILNSKSPFYVTILNPKNYENKFKKTKKQTLNRIKVGI